MPDVERPARLGNVLVATDFVQSDALDRAVRLPITPGSSITLLHVVPTDLPETIERSFRRNAERLVAELATSARARLEASGRGDVDVYHAVETGKPVEVICEQAQSLRAQLVVVGRTALPPTPAHPIGATAERVARASDTPVLIVAQRPIGPYRKPLIAIDGGELSPTVVDMALRVAEPGLASAEILRAFTAPDLGILRESDLGPEEMGDYVAQYARRARRDLAHLLPTLPQRGVVYEPVVREGDARRVLLDEAARKHSDLIAVGTRGHSRWIRLLMGSVAEAVVRNAAIDVLVVR